VFTKEEIYNRIWKDDYIENPNALNVHIYHLRRKLEKNRKANREACKATSAKKH
jgi:DNA-binding response OmpR family regulator